MTRPSAHGRGAHAPIKYPEGKRFAFTIFDDTDVATLDSIRPVYDLLDQLGFRTTKTVWPLDYAGPSSFAGSATLEDDDYCAYLRALQAKGFEIAFHGATMETALRADTARALAKFRTVFGAGPAAYAAHAENRDNLYWGKERFQFALWRSLYQVIAGRSDPASAGHVPGSAVYWLDLAPELRYVRSFTYHGIDLLRITECIPYATAGSPAIAGWFPSCDAEHVEQFVDLLCDRNQELLESNRGLCILSTHLGKGFVHDGRVIPRVENVLRRLSRRQGWFVPLTELLDFLVQQRGAIPLLRGWPLFRLEGLWFLHSVLRKRRKKSYRKTEIPYLEAAIADKRAKLGS